MKTTQQSITHCYISLMLLVFPLWTGFEGYVNIGFGKFYFFIVTTAIWLLGLLVLAFANPLPRSRPTPLQVAVFLFACTCVLSWLFSELSKTSLLVGERYDGLVFLLFLALSLFFAEKYGRISRGYIWLLAASCTLCSLIAVMQILGFNFAYLYPSGLSFGTGGTLHSGSYLGTFGNANLLSAFYALTVPIFSWSLFTISGRKKLLLLIPIALALFIAIYAGLSSFLTAFAAFLLIAFPFWIARKKRKLLTTAAVFLSPFCLIGFLAAVYFISPSGGTLGELSSLLHGRSDDGFGSHRLMIWREALSLASKRPLFGFGPASYGHISEISFSRYVQDTGVTLISYVDNTHNEYLGYLVQTGLFSLFFYLFMCFFCLSNIRRESAAPFVFGISAYLIQSFFGLGLCPVLPIVWIIMGISCSEEEANVDSG